MIFPLSWLGVMVTDMRSSRRGRACMHASQALLQPRVLCPVLDQLAATPRAFALILMHVCTCPCMRHRCMYTHARVYV